MKRDPPRLAIWILTGILPGDRALEVLGALEESFSRRPRLAALWYWRETLLFAARLLPHRLGDALRVDMRYSARRLRNRPLLTGAVVVTLAFCVGATTAMYSVVRSVVLRPLPFPSSERILALCETNELVGDYCVASPPDVENWKERSRTVAKIGIARYWLFNVRLGERSESVVGGLATASFFEVFGIDPFIGRLLRPGDEGVALVSFELWQTLFGGDASIVGRSIQVDGKPFEIVGVLPVEAKLPWHERVQLWTPLPFDPKDEENREWRGFTAAGRLRDGFTVEEAQSEMETIASSLAAEYPATNSGWGVRVRSLRLEMVGAMRSTLFLFLGAVALVYLIGCVNVANLLLARNAEREREVAVGIALGAGRKRVMSQLMTESLLLSCLGGGLGFVLSIVATRGLLWLAPPDIPRIGEVSPDGTVLAAVFGLSILTALVFGILPAWRATGVDPGRALSSGARGLLRVARTGPGGALVVAELSLAVVLLVSAGLLLRSFSAIQDWKPGFERDGLLTFQLFSSPANYPEGAQVTRFFERVADEVRSIPGVVSVGASSAGPLFGGRETTELAIEGLDSVDGAPPLARWYDVDPGYFQTLALPLREGRWFTDTDRDDAPRVAIVNEAMARKYWPSDAAIGKRVTTAGDGIRWEIVGVVGNVTPFYPDAVAEAEIYWPKAQFPRWATFFLVRSALDPEALVAIARDRLQKLDPDATLRRVSTMDELVRHELRAPCFQMLLMTVFASGALILAVVGVYGVVAYGVAQRQHEFGLRMSLGASRSDIVRLVLGNSLRVVVLGLALGIAGALASTHMLSRLLHGVGERDLLTFSAVAVLMLAVAFLASYVPARRASGLDPVVTLRND